MPSRLDIVRENTHAVLDNETGLTEDGYFRQLTSQATATPRTYGDWIYCQVLITGMRHEQSYDDTRQGHRITKRASLRISDRWGPLAVGYQYCRDPHKTPSDEVWQVLGIESGVPGSTRWQIGRDIPVIATADRKGGL